MFGFGLRLALALLVVRLFGRGCEWKRSVDGCWKWAGVGVDGIEGGGWRDDVVKVVGRLGAWSLEEMTCSRRSAVGRRI